MQSRFLTAVTEKQPLCPFPFRSMTPNTAPNALFEHAFHSSHHVPLYPGNDALYSETILAGDDSENYACLPSTTVVFYPLLLCRSPFPRCTELYGNNNAMLTFPIPMLPRVLHTDRCFSLLAAHRARNRKSINSTVELDFFLHRCC